MVGPYFLPKLQKFLILEVQHSVSFQNSYSTAKNVAILKGQFKDQGTWCVGPQRPFWWCAKRSQPLGHQSNGDRMSKRCTSWVEWLPGNEWKYFFRWIFNTRQFCLVPWYFFPFLQYFCINSIYGNFFSSQI